MKKIQSVELKTMYYMHGDTVTVKVPSDFHIIDAFVGEDDNVYLSVVGTWDSELVNMGVTAFVDGADLPEEYEDGFIKSMYLTESVCGFYILHLFGRIF